MKKVFAPSLDSRLQPRPKLAARHYAPGPEGAALIRCRCGRPANWLYVTLAACFKCWANIDFEALKG